MKDVLVIIPARGGSKRVPRKNIKPICGQPMIYWPLMALSKLFRAEQILLSTDDAQIAAVVREKGVATPYTRPDSLADDFTGTMAVAAHALNWHEQNVGKVDSVLIVYPTAVLLNPQDIQAAYAALTQDASCDLIMAATTFPFPIQRAVFKNSHGYAQMFQPEHAMTRSQDLTEALHDAGQFYLCRAEAVRREMNVTNANVGMQILNRKNVVDIDTVEDFDVAESKMKTLGLDAYDAEWRFH
ncbi:pseudaminic acid cytidylyltransferase [Magnetofaba australis]|uniref:Putative pseudaminic acid CMP-transferase n=1 Tax=Magnetofaba australis IT-1 TaxID=1434232 RepID=A0A1Y2K4X7_9PROT|nr:pseudaminic acid cytidylyltransferase [Magnetofaba australis]OSM02055.1 putative pseudaminic acid CMP-transferase [Magnetofaba australis IT-1]